ncbi:MAG: hypothetical protein GY739_21465, partial [Mesoflavibacter sp.]|nr:hypothetical protein [Mesoflavibacter sp.]
DEGRKDYLPDAYKEFFDGNNFFVWNREKVGRYLEQNCNYTIGANFISVEGLLQQMNLHIACILRTNTNSDDEWTERVQLVCSQQDIQAAHSVKDDLVKSIELIAEMTATGANLLTHVLFVIAQLFTPKETQASPYVRTQMAMLQLQMKVDPLSLLLEESHDHDVNTATLAKEAEFPLTLFGITDQIAREIMNGRKANREQYFLGSAANETFDMMTAIIQVLNTPAKQHKFSLDQRAIIRGQCFLTYRKEIFEACYRYREAGTCNHPSSHMIVNKEDDYDDFGQKHPSRCKNLAAVLMRERLTHGHIQGAPYLAAMTRLKNAMTFNIVPNSDSGFYSWDAERLARNTTYDDAENISKCAVDRYKKTMLTPTELNEQLTQLKNDRRD